MRRTLSVASTALAVIVMFSQTAFASSIYPGGSTGIDVGYPNCSAAVPSVDFGIVGVNAGTVYSHNLCVSKEARHFNNLSLYVNTGLNASQSSPYYVKAQYGCNGNTYCAAYAYGFNAAEDALSYASSQGISSNKWWLDVETNGTWNSDTAQNMASLQGEHDALASAGATTVGVYSTTVQWQEITGGWQNNWPSWGATTWNNAKQARTYCSGHQFSGGPSLLMQYQSKKSRLDQDVAC